MKLPARLPLLLFAAALGAAWWRALPPGAADIATPPPAAQTVAGNPQRSLLPGSGPASTQPTLTELGDGTLLAAWREGEGKQATIRLAALQAGAMPRIVVDREWIASVAGMATTGLGRPLLFARGDTLHLWVEGEHPGGHRLHGLRSTDGGANWQADRPLLTSPLFNLGSRLTAPPLALADGGLALPLGHALLSTHGEWLRLDAGGRILDKARLSAPPVGVVRLADGQLLAALASADGTRLASSPDGGQRWLPIPTEAAPPAPAQALLALRDGRLLLLAGQHWHASSDNGQHWRDLGAPPLPPEAAGPVVLQARDGYLHLLAATSAGLLHQRLSPPAASEAAR